MSKRKLKTLGFFALGTVAAACALAQSTSELKSVVVTAQKRAQGANDVGMAISTISGDDLKEGGVVSIGDVINSLPGMTATESAFGLPVYTMRGVGNDDTQSAQQSPTVGIYVDQVVQPYALLTRGANLDLERVEVLKGPQGTLYGQSTTGGLINFIARKPTKSLEYGGTVGTGSFGASNVDAYVSGPLAEGMRGRVAVMTRDGGDWQRSVSRDEKTGGKGLAAMRAQLEFGQGGDFDALLAINHWRDKSSNPASQPNGLNPGNPKSPAAKRLTNQFSDDARDAEWTSAANRQAANPANTRGYGFDQEFNSLTATMNWKLGGGTTLTSLTNSGRFTRDDMLSSIPLPQENNDLHIKGQIDVFSQELRFAGKSGAAQWVAGGFYSRNNVKERQNNYTKDLTALEAVTNVFDGNQFFNETDTTTTSKALFGQVEFELNNKLNLTAGVRHNRDQNDFNGCSGDSGDGSMAVLLNAGYRGLPGPFMAGQCTTALTPGVPGRVIDQLSEKATSGRVGLDWKLSPGTLAYGTVSKGVKGGGYPTVGATNAAQLKPVLAENLMAYETGIKWTAPDRRAQVNASIFHYEYNDKQVRGFVKDPTFGMLARLINIPKAQVQGLDIDAKFKATDALTLSARLAITDSKVKQYVGLDRTGANVDYAGASFPLTPREQTTLSADYRLGLGSFFGTLGIDVNHASSSKGTGSFILGNPAWAVPSRTVVDLRFGLQPSVGNWRVFGSIKNLTDQYYWTDARQLNDINARYAGKPRTLAVNLSYDFY